MDEEKHMSELSPDCLAAAVRAVEAALAADELRDACAPTHFVSDIHGEAAAFEHLVRSASGEVRAYVEKACVRAGVDLGEDGLAALCALLYYPEDPGLVQVARAAGVVGAAGLAARVRARVCGHLHMVGDIWDRGARGDLVMDTLMACPSVDVQWGNHDVCWMGAAAGDPACIATVLRNNLKYGNTAQFEEGYGISLEPLRVFAARTYGDEGPDAPLSPVMKAISMLLFKSEGQAIRRHPEWHMEGRLLLDKVNLAEGTVRVGEGVYPLRTRDFPTLGGVPGSADMIADPYAFSSEEARLMEGLVAAFCGSARLQRQIGWLYEHGGTYLVDGRWLLVHGCVPMTCDGTLAEVVCGDGAVRSGRALLDWTDAACRRAWEGRAQTDLDWMGFFWTGWQSTFMGRVVKTFERTYIEDESTWKEPEDPYYALTKEDAAPCRLVLEEFGVDPTRGVIVNGHTPVKLPKGQVPVRGGGRRVVVDGGFCRAYRKSTGIAGYTLVDDAASGAVRLVTHGDFPGLPDALTGADMAHAGEDITAQLG